MRRGSAARFTAMTALFVAAGLLLYSTTPGAAEAPGAWRAAAVSLGALALWATGVIPEMVTAVAFFLLCVLLGVAPPGTIFSGFASTAFWLAFGGLLIGMSVKRTGLGARLAHVLVGRIGGSYLALCLGIALVGMMLAFLMPSSMGRVVLLTPVVLSLADSLGFKAGSRGRAGLVLLTGYIGFNPPIAVLPAVVPNMVMIGAADTLYGVEFQYVSWLTAFLPTLGLVKAGLVVGVCWALFRQTPDAPPPEEHPGPLSAEERRLALTLGATLALWASDSLHGISPAWVALASGLSCMLPGPRGGAPLIPMQAFNERFNFANLVHLAGLLGLGAVVAQTGLGAAVGGWLMAELPLAEDNTAGNFIGLGAIASGLGLLATTPGAPAVMTPLAEQLAAATGWPLRTVLLAQVVGYSTVLLPYQVPPLIVAMHMGGVGPAPAARMTLTIFVLTLVLVWPLTYLWWRGIGVF